MKKVFLCTAFLILISPIVLFLVHHIVHADYFYGSNGNISNCFLSVALGFSYDSPGAIDPHIGSISYASTALKGISYTDMLASSFNTYGNDLFPNASRLITPDLVSQLPPATTVHVFAFFKNTNPYDVHIPGNSILFTSLTNPANGNIANLFSSIDSPPQMQSGSFVFGSATYSRTGQGITIPSIGTIPANAEVKKEIFSFHTVLPLIALRTITSEVSSNGEVTLHAVLKVKNQSIYPLHYIEIRDGSLFDQTDTFQPGEEKEYTYSGDIGPVSGVMHIPGVSIIDQNNPREVFMQNEDKYGGNMDAIAGLFPRDDEDGPNGWSANQTALTLYRSQATMSLSLIPYTFSTPEQVLTFQPQLRITKTQNGTIDPIVVHTAEAIEYKVKIENIGHIPASDIILVDPIHNALNVVGTDGTECMDKDIYIENVTCHAGVGWNIGTLGVGESREVLIHTVVSNRTFLDEDIPNMANINFNRQYVLFSNQVDAHVSPMVMGVATNNSILHLHATAVYGEVQGIVWEDSNINGVVDSGEKVIAQAFITLQYGSTLLHATTRSDGTYLFQSLPYNTLFHVHIVKPQGYSFMSTYSNYDIMLTHDPHILHIHILGDTVHVLTTDSMSQASLGAYNHIFAQTGQSIFPILLLFLIFITSFLVYLIREYQEDVCKYLRMLQQWIDKMLFYVDLSHLLHLLVDKKK